MTPIIFNKADKGYEELKALLGYFDAQFNFEALIPDIEQQTPLLINYIGKEAYLTALYHYDADKAPEGFTPIADKDDLQNAIVKQMQTYIITMAALNYMQSGDLEHTNSGRKQNRTDNQVTPWEWQLDRDNAAHLKRAYRALDMLIAYLDELNHESWTDSDAYKKSRSLFIYKTQILDDIYPINNSGQLYYRMVPLMADHEIESIYPLIGSTKYTELKGIIEGNTEADISLENKVLLNHIRKAITYLTMADAYDMLPVEMFPDKVEYNMKPKDFTAVWEEKVQRLRDKAQLHLRNVEQQYAIINMTTATVARDPLSGLNEENNHVSL
ncbi:DUF6712 family protein [Leeuwenhoekiella sp. A16]|uniref:DUF6712 family protein n=1 Tax=Leeuwenhoekiella sp. A16 TaxID=3141462 RepID=UPI003A8060FA